MSSQDAPDWIAVLWQQSEQTLQRTLTSVQMEWGGEVRSYWEKIMVALATVRLSQSLESLETPLQEVVSRLSPIQLEAVIGEIPIAAERALVASYLYHHQFDEHYRSIAARSYGLSGLPLVLNRDEQIHVEASAVLGATLIAVNIAGATSDAILPLFGSPYLKKLLKAEQELREESLQKSQRVLETAQANVLTSQEDWYLSLTNVGIQAAQITEFLGLQLKAILNSRLLQLLIPGLALEALELLTSDLLFSVSNTLEAQLDDANSLRRLTLLGEALPLAQRIPFPADVLRLTPTVLKHMEECLRPLLVKQLKANVEALDPQIRNTWLNEIGRQLNLWNPMQFLQATILREWLIQTQSRVEVLRIRYPSLRILAVYSKGLEAALEQNRLMEQAQSLRATLQNLDTFQGN
jgi:hypothetical protein